MAEHLTTRNTILRAVRDHLRSTLTGVEPSRIELRAIRAHEVDRQIRIGIAWRHDMSGRSDGDAMQMTMTMLVGVMFEVDPSQALEQMLQASELYDQVHAELEALSETGIDGQALAMELREPGIEHSEIDDHERSEWMGSAWDVTYRRARKSR